MFYVVDVFVLCTIEETHYEDRKWYDTVEYRFGINAETKSDAVQLATHAAKHALDRNGKYIGGIVKKYRAIPATDFEIKELRDYCFLPIENRGIFYVSGVGYSSVGYDKYPNSLPRHRNLARRIKANGLPHPTFRHPEVDTRYVPRVCRLLCPRCHQWVEFDQGAFFFAFFSGIECLPDEYDRLKSARQIHDTFSAQHAHCLANGETALEYLHDSDERFSCLDPKDCVARDSRLSG